MKPFILFTWLAAAAAMVLGCFGCEADNDPASDDSDDDDDNDDNDDNDSSDDDDDNSDDDDDTSGDDDDDNSVPAGDEKIAGTVQSATGFPISGALVYLSTQDGPEIPDGIYCYECDEVPQGRWTLSNADGSWSIDTAPNGTYNIITRKGGFQRQRELTIEDSDDIQNVPAELTTLPGAASADGLDQIPNYAVLLNYYDRVENLLAKMGLGELDTTGKLVHGTQNFDMYNDMESSNFAVGASSTLFNSQATLDQYHMIFFPCICEQILAAGKEEMLRLYVSGGGKLYSSCWASHWAEKPFSEVIDFNGDDTGQNPGNVGEYDTYGTITDQAMRDWLSVVAPAQNLDSYPFVEGWIQIDGLSFSAYDGHGVVVDDNGVASIEGPVTPYVWVTDNQYNPSGPLTLTYNFDCGKVFYSTYHVTTATSTTMAPQEWVLVYLFYEIGVCEGEPDEVPPV